MTRREYLQSLKDQGKTKEEAIELTKQWEIDNKPVEVEKTEVVAKNTAPVTAQEESSTESSSEDTSLESTEVKEPEIKKPNKSKRRRDKYFVANDNGKMITFNTKLEYDNWVDGTTVDVESEDEIPISKVGLFGKINYNKKTKEFRKLTDDDKTLGNKEKIRRQRCCKNRCTR